jgi:predicted metallo-beta-lactamase superfamily hydrolase
MALGGIELEEVLRPPEAREYPDPLESLTEALSRSFGDYEPRRQELLRKGGKWFERRAREWGRSPRIPEMRGDGFEVGFADGRVFEVCGATLRFTEPLFHGVEYSRVGWVVALTIDAGKTRIHYSSDVNGPIIEDYASMIIDLYPDILVLDGPPTYMLGYMLNNTNLRRAVDNAVRILRETSRLKLAIYDHHLLREPRYKEHTLPVWREAERQGVTLTTAAEHLGMIPAVLRGRSNV